MTPASAPDRTYLSGVDRGVRMAVGIAILLKSLVFLSTYVSTFTEVATIDRGIGLAMLLLVEIPAVRLIQNRGSAWDIASCTTAMLLAFCLTQTRADPAPLAGAVNSPIVNFSEPLLVGIAVLSARWCVLNLAAHFVIFTTGRTITAGTEGLGYGLQESLWMTGVLVGAFVLVEAIRQAARRADAARDDVEAALLQSAEVDLRSGADHTAQQVIHDVVLPALIAVGSHPGTDTSRESGSDALTALGHSWSNDQSPTSPFAIIDSVCASSDVTTSMVVDPHVRVIDTPPGVADSLGKSVAELLRNVERHSGSSKAQIVIEPLGRSGLRITVSDDGVGFDPDQTVGVGLRRSVYGRMAEITGTVDLSSAPGHGVSATLNWPNLAPGNAFDRSYAEISAAIDTPSAVALRAIAPIMTVVIGAAILFALFGNQRPVALVSAGVLGFLSVALARETDRGPFTPLLVGLVSVVMVPCTWLGLSVVAPGEIGGFASWVIEFASVPIIVIAFLAPVRALWAPLISQAVLIAWFGLDSGMSVAELPHVLLIQPINALFVAAVSSMIRRNGRAISSLQEQMIELSVDRSRARARVAAIDELLCGHRSDVARFFRRVGAGQSGPLVADTARELTHQVRDCLYLPGSSHEALRGALSRLRQSGCEVAVRAAEDLPATGPLARLLDDLTDAKLCHHTLTVSLHLSDSSDGRLVIVPAISDEMVESLTSRFEAVAHIHSDGEATFIAWGTRVHSEPVTALRTDHLSD